MKISTHATRVKLLAKKVVPDPKYTNFGSGKYTYLLLSSVSVPHEYYACFYYVCFVDDLETHHYNRMKNLAKENILQVEIHTSGRGSLMDMERRAIGL